MPGMTDNATIGDHTVVEDGACVGWRYHKDCGPAVIGENGIIRRGTLIYGDVKIGDYFQSGHYVVIRARVKMGNYCGVLNHSAIEGIVRFGDGVRINSHVYIPSRTWFGDHVFVGPGVTFLNDKLPARRESSADLTPRGAMIRDNVVIGGGCTILPGVTIGEGSFIAAGALVTKDVPPMSLVMGAPGRIEPLPERLRKANDRRITTQPRDLWHPDTPDLRGVDWPRDWEERFED